MCKCNVSVCKDLEDTNSSMKKRGSGEGRQMGKFAPHQRKENRRWLSKMSLGFRTEKAVADGM